MDQKFLVYCQTKLVCIQRSEIEQEFEYKSFTCYMPPIYCYVHVPMYFLYNKLVHGTSSCSAITERNACKNFKKICLELWPLECTGEVFKYRSKLVARIGANFTGPGSEFYHDNCWISSISLWKSSNKAVASVGNGCGAASVWLWCRVRRQFHLLTLLPVRN